MELSSDLQQKKDWLPYLALFVEKMGHATLHWVDRINSMLSDYTTSCDPQYLVLIVKVIEALIKSTWSKPSSREWIQIILKILYNQGVFSVTEGELDDHSDEVHERIKNCFELMSKCEDFSECKMDLIETLEGMRANSLDNLYQQKFLKELDKCDLTEFL
jgi:hypothetical protein